MMTFIATARAFVAHDPGRAMAIAMGFLAMIPLAGITYELWRLP